MDLALVRTEFRPDGIFGELRDPGGELIVHTLEHGYGDGFGGIQPKLPDGQYTCVRGEHQLKNMPHLFETFEITNVPGHTNILIHVGNFDFDSEGCVLVGISVSQLNGRQALGASKSAFAKFMRVQDGCDSFQLTVSSS